MRKLTSAFLLLMMSVNFVQAFEIKYNKAKIDSVTKDVLKAFEAVAEADQPKLNVVFTKHSSEDDVNKILKKYSWITKLEVKYTKKIVKIDGLKKAKSLKILKLISLQASKETPFDLGGLKSVKTLEEVNFRGTIVTNLEALASSKGLEKVNFYMSPVSSLEFLAKTPNVKWLDLYGYKHTFPDYKPLAKLKNLEYLNVYMNKQATDENLAALSELKNIKTFKAANCKLFTNINFLMNCTQLEKLDLKWARGLVDISGAAGMVNLVELDIDDSKVSDISVLANCVKLEELDISGTGVSDFDGLKNLKSLKRLTIQSSVIMTDIKFVKELKTLTHLDIKDSKVTDLSPLKGNLIIESITLRKTGVKDISPLYECKNLKYLRLDSDFDEKQKEAIKAKIERIYL